MLVQDRPPPGEGEPAPLEPNWRLWRWLPVAAVLGFAAVNAGGLIGFLLVCATFAALCKAAAELVDYGAGLRDWRQ